MANQIGARFTAGVLALVVSTAAAASAQPRDPVPQPQPIRQWKLDDVSRVRWQVRESPKVPKVQSAKQKSNRTLAVMLIGIGGAVAGGFFGSTVQGSLCECDDRRTVGAAYGALFGGAAAGIIAYSVLR